MEFSRRKFLKMAINFNYNYPQLAREAGFRLRQYKDGPLDWRLLGCFEIERLLRDQSLEEIDKVLLHLSEAPLGSALLETNILDNGIAKYFIVSQFAIQYLLFCRNFLDETVQELRESYAEAQVEVARLKKLLSESNNEILQLHKKMTQMEAIHEVIYPCHLCTKNFANNEALNIHIGRKHPNQNRTMNERKLEANTTNDLSKERTKDLTLINTIKLELEIKQLKERLNNAEKEIKERHQSAGNSKQNSAREILETPPETRNVAIQSNLSEEKEKNESKDDDGVEGNVIVGHTVELDKLQEKIYDIEEWRATQMANNEDSIAEINRKLTNIAQVLERTTTKDTVNVRDGENEVFPIQSLERRLSVEDLERVLSEKVAEIGKANSEKLEKIVQNMEVNYRDKLFELEREVQKAIIEKEENHQQQNEMKITRVKRSSNEFPPTVIAEEIKIMEKTKEARKTNDSSESGEEGTYNIESDKEQILTENKKKSKLKISQENPSQNTETNHTYIKTLETKPKAMARRLLLEEKELSDNTDISESLSEDEQQAMENPNEKSIKVEVEKIMKADGTEKPKTVMTIAEKSTNVKIPKAKSPKKYTRKDAKNLASKRLAKYGFDMKAKSISSNSLKRVNSNLNERRNKLKQEYPDFYATRNKIKKFVEKLCTTKTSKKAEKLLMTTPTLQPWKAPTHIQKQLSTELEENSQTTDDNGSDDQNNIQKTKKLEMKNTKDDFKKRLERLLASPVQRPVSSMLDLEKKNTTVAQVHDEQRVNVLPLPMPRKRVMFNTSANTKTAANVLDTDGVIV